jgi:hypothetical protein
MTETLTDDRPGFVAEEPEHCRDFCRLIHPGKIYYLTTEQVVVCPDCASAADAIRLAGGLTVKIREDKLLVRRANVSVEEFRGEARHHLDRLVEAAAGLRYTLLARLYLFGQHRSLRPATSTASTWITQNGRKSWHPTRPSANTSTTALARTTPTPT